MDGDFVVKGLLDGLVSLFILLFIFGSRFNQWPEQVKSQFGGRPSEYIARTRYYGFAFLYVATFAVATLVIKNFPQLLELFPDLPFQKIEPSPEPHSASESEGHPASGWYSLSESYFLYLLFWAVSVSNLKIVKRHDDRWRAILLEWARIPREVEELISSVAGPYSFYPVPGFRDRLASRLAADNGAKINGESLQQFWLVKLDEIEQLRTTGSVFWFYLKSIGLSIQAQEVCADLRIADVKARDERIRELGAILAFKDEDATEIQAYTAELEKISYFYVECLCKHLVRKYSSKKDQLNALNNFGFTIQRLDFVEPKLRESIAWCLLGVLVVSCAYISVLLYLRDGKNPGFFTIERFLQWESGSFVCFSLAIFVGFFMKAFPRERENVNLMRYICTFVLATLGSYVYFQISRELGSFTDDKPWARFVLAMSFATLSLFVLPALERVSHDRWDVLQFSVFQGVVLGLIMLFLQIAISVSFGWEASYGMLAPADWLMDENYYLVKVGLVGFWKGFLLAFIISYAIQTVMRRRLLASLRKDLRADDAFLVRFRLEDEEVVASIRNISKHGLKIRCRHALVSEQAIKLSSNLLGDFQAIVRWSSGNVFGNQVAGLEIPDDVPGLQNYLRERHGEIYA